MTALHDAGADVGARLEATLGRPVERLERLSGGASRETWAFTCGGRDLILRRDPPGRAAEFGSMALEAAAIGAAAAAGLAVPDVLVVDDGSRLGTAGMVMSRVGGETMARRILRDPGFAEARQALPAQLAGFVAGLHRVAVDAVPGLPEPDPIGYLEEMYGEVGDASPTFDTALRWLRRHRPDPGGRVIVHGDLRLGNVIVGPEGLRAVIDWELLHVGDPLEDLAWICVKAWRFGAAPEAAGLGTIDELLRAYEAAGGASVERSTFDWWLVEKTLQWGIVCMKQGRVHLSGADRSVELAAVGRRAAEVEWDLLELLAPGTAPREARPARPPAAVDEPGLYGRPTAEELLEAAEEFLRSAVADATGGQVRFHARVAANVLAIVARQLRAGPEPAARAAAGLEKLGAASFDELSARIRAGGFDDREAELHPFLWETVADRLSVANPRHLGEGG
ncbi:MAG TPA: phosphotransferase family protein [Acidimicrobiia bacterium]|nr:phosphotransferase family protein [Acidimicrobiia bacterium]